ncbi:hypothetical protein [Deinococcus knuensis]|nr:hypothetical protein [Deinococcus knuensis]
MRRPDPGALHARAPDRRKRDLSNIPQAFEGTFTPNSGPTTP